MTRVSVILPLFCLFQSMFGTTTTLVQSFSVAVVSSNHHVKTAKATAKITATRQFMFSADADNSKSEASSSSSPAVTSGKPLETVSAFDQAATTTTTTALDSSRESAASNYVRDMNTGEIKEVKWVDPAMTANTDPFNLGWAYIFIILPATLIANDFLHFIDADGPLGFLAKY